MKLEDQKVIELIQNGKLGTVKFFRYSLATHIKHKALEKEILGGIFQFIQNSGTKNLKKLTASVSRYKRVTLLTLEFENQVMANIYISYSPNIDNYTKILEVVGDKGMYQFDSDKQVAFSSTFISREYIIDRTIELTSFNNWFDLIEKSLALETSIKEEN